MATGAAEVYKREIVTVDEYNDALLTNTPKDEELIALYSYGSDGVEDVEYDYSDEAPGLTEYNLDGKLLSFNAGVEEGTRFVAYYIADTAVTTQTLTVSSDKFPAAFEMVMEVLVTDFHTKELYPAQIVIPSCRMEDNWTLSFN